MGLLPSRTRSAQTSDFSPVSALATWAPAGESDAYNVPVDFYGGDTVYAKIVDFDVDKPRNSVLFGKAYSARQGVETLFDAHVGEPCFDVFVPDCKYDDRKDNNHVGDDKQHPKGYVCRKHGYDVIFVTVIRFGKRQYAY